MSFYLLLKGEISGENRPYGPPALYPGTFTNHANFATFIIVTDTVIEM